MISNRVFVSFDEPCYYQCKHCYTYAITRDRIRSTKEIVDSIVNEVFDVIYVSQKTDNFHIPKRGIELCEQLFERYEANQFVITRSVFNDEEICRFQKLLLKANSKNKKLFIAVSMNSMQSNYMCEDTERVPSPESRIAFLRELSECGFDPILMLRPIFPNSIIPVSECLQIIEMCAPFVSCVVASGLGVNDDVLSRLNLKDRDFIYSENQEYLQGAIECEMKFVDVSAELSIIKEFCKKNSCAFFEHSIPALNYIASMK